MKVLKYKYNPDKKGVFKVSVVKNPAVGEGDLVLMSAQEIKGIFYSPVMIPDLQIQRVDESTGEKYMVYYDAETVEQLMHNYMKQNGNAKTNIEHSAVDVDGIYPVENWTVQDSENDKSKALGMPTQKEGTWIQGYKCDSPELLEQIKDKLLQGLSIEGHLDTEEETDNPITKFNKQKTMFEKIKEGLGNLLTLMSADEEKPVEETPAETTESVEEEKPVEEMAVDEAPAEATEPNELETANATIEELEKKVADLEAELATFKNDATLMSAQLEEEQTAFQNYKAVKMSSQKLGDTPAVEKILTPIEMKQAKFLEETKSKLN